MSETDSRATIRRNRYPLRYDGCVEGFGHTATNAREGDGRSAPGLY
jgi:hypothetical protein